MSSRLVVRPEAEADIEAAYLWYEEQRPGLGEIFLAELRHTLDRVVDNPRLYQEVYPEARRALPRRFPYGIFYLIAGDEVVVLAVTHQARHPGVWRSRLPSSEE